VPVRSGERAVQALMDGEYALVPLDIMMPRLDGFETAAQIRRHARGRDVPAIFLTAATDQPEQAFRSYPAGAVDDLAARLANRILQLREALDGLGGPAG
jgi:CheY-like chemotaxis protein